MAAQRPHPDTAPVSPAVLAAAIASCVILAGAATPASAAELGKGLKKAMIDETDRVPVIVRWAAEAGAGAAGGKASPAGSRALGAGLVRELPRFGMSAARLSSAEIQKLAQSPQVSGIHLDEPIALDDPPADPVAPRDVLEAEKKSRLAWGVETIEAHRVWSELSVTGRGVRVGIVDTGIDGLHPLFASKLRAWGDLTGHLSPEPDDRDGHGTHVAGTIAGGAGPDGIRLGVAPDAELVIGRALGSRQGSLGMILAALAFVADPDGDPRTDDGARVINCSFGGTSPEADPVWTDVLAELAARGVVVVVAAGNGGRDGAGTVAAPAYLAGSLAVGALGPDRKRAVFSGHSPPVLGNRPRSFLKPDVCAPGVSVLSLGQRNTFERMNGTSMAAPHVTGTIALMLQANPSLTAGEVREILEETATDVGETGRDPEHGSGLVNAYGAVKRALEMKDVARAEPSVDQLLAEGQRAMVANHLQRAIDRFMRVIQTQDHSNESARSAMYYLGEAYARQGNFRGAVACFKKLVEIAPDSPMSARARFQIGKAYKETPTAGPQETVVTLQKSIEAFDQFLAAHPGHEWVPLALVEKAKCLVALNRVPEGVEIARAVAARYANQPAAAAAMELLSKLEAGQGSDPLQ
jgi:subtilisin family serine protease